MHASQGSEHQLVTACRSERPKSSQSGKPASLPQTETVRPEPRPVHAPYSVDVHAARAQQQLAALGPSLLGRRSGHAACSDGVSTTRACSAHQGPRIRPPVAAASSSCSQLSFCRQGLTDLLSAQGLRVAPGGQQSGGVELPKVCRLLPGYGAVSDSLLLADWHPRERQDPPFAPTGVMCLQGCVLRGRRRGLFQAPGPFLQCWPLASIGRRQRTSESCTAFLRAWSEPAPCFLANSARASPGGRSGTSSCPVPSPYPPTCA